MTRYLSTFSLLAVLPLAAAMPLGERIGKRFDARPFDRVIPAFPGLLALRPLCAELS